MYSLGCRTAWGRFYICRLIYQKPVRSCSYMVWVMTPAPSHWNSCWLFSSVPSQSHWSLFTVAAVLLTLFSQWECALSAVGNKTRNATFNSCIHPFKNNNVHRASYIKPLPSSCFKAKVHHISKILDKAWGNISRHVSTQRADGPQSRCGERQ